MSDRETCMTQVQASQSQLTPLDAKILQVLGDRVILKPLTRWNEAYKEFPRFVMEYLVSRYVDPTDPIAGQHKIDKILSRCLVNLQYDSISPETAIGRTCPRLEMTRCVSLRRSLHSTATYS